MMNAPSAPPSEPELLRCRACGQPFAPDALRCPVCRVSRKGDVNRPAILAYAFFLLSMLLGGLFVYYRLRGFTAP